MKVGILGMGEVGKSLFSLYIDNGITPLKKDIKNKKEMGSLSILNICIPYNKNFIQNVVNEISKTNPELILDDGEMLLDNGLTSTYLSKGGDLAALTEMNAELWLTSRVGESYLAEDSLG